MMEHGFFHTSIDLKLPQFAQPVSDNFFSLDEKFENCQKFDLTKIAVQGQSSPETAVRSLVNYIYNGTLDGKIY